MTSSDNTAAEFAAIVGARVRDLRKARGMSLGELAKATGLGKGTLSELESGRRNPTLATLFAITTALGVPISAALPVTEESAGAGEPIRGDAIEATLVERFTDVSAVTEVYRVQVMAGREQDSAPHASGVTEHWIVYAGVLELGPAEAMVRL